ncbi:hypothetical protein SEA_MARKY_1 [Streptomyces phage Marky]|nr:hypothetical protein SEA_MARKY_1 [Streptomyces phage Marky]
MEQREIRQHQHDGPRTGQTEDEQWILTCQTCGIPFMEGMEDMTALEVKDMMEILNPTEDGSDG